MVVFVFVNNQCASTKGGMANTRIKSILLVQTSNNLVRACTALREHSFLIQVSKSVLKTPAVTLYTQA